MELGAINYFFIILGGFGIVWSFRKACGIKKELGDFEYLGFSAFWGGILLATYVLSFEGDIEKLNQAIKIPFLAGITLFVFGCILGYLFGKIYSKIKYRS